MTFLVRAPKIQIEPLSENRITRAYEQLLEVPTSEAREMARFTKGYPFGYQVLGNIIFQNHYTLQEAVPDFDDYIQDYSYDLTWSELSSTDRQILLSMALNGFTKVEDIRTSLKMTSNTFTKYRSRLIKKGILTSPKYGYLEMALPRFKEFVLRICDDSK